MEVGGFCLPLTAYCLLFMMEAPGIEPDPQAYNVIEDSNGKTRIHPQITQITQISSKADKKSSCNCASVSSSKLLSAYQWDLRNLWIGGFALAAHCLLLTVLWWRRRELNPDPKANAEGLYMLSCFSFRQTFQPDKFRPIPTK